MSGREQRSADWIANMLAVRMIRQERLTDDEHPLELDAVMHESALHYPVGGASVMRNQFVEPARLRFSHLRSLALSPDESVALIERVADDLWPS